MEQLDLDLFIVIKREELLDSPETRRFTIGEVFSEYEDAKEYISRQEEMFVPEKGKDTILDYQIITRKLN